MSAPKYRNGEWVTVWIPEIGTVTGYMRRRRSCWIFRGDILKDICWTLRKIRRKGGHITTHRAP